MTVGQLIKQLAIHNPNFSLEVVMVKNPTKSPQATIGELMIVKLEPKGQKVVLTAFDTDRDG